MFYTDSRECFYRGITGFFIKIFENCKININNIIKRNVYPASWTIRLFKERKTNLENDSEARPLYSPSPLRTYVPKARYIYVNEYDRRRPTPFQDIRHTTDVRCGGRIGMVIPSNANGGWVIKKKKKTVTLKKISVPSNIAVLVFQTKVSRSVN